jgi:alpha-beta hydrolase superfamily lysophospholipase
MLFTSSKRFSCPRCGSRLIFFVISAVLMTSCATQIDVKAATKIYPHLEEKQYTSFDADALGYEKWTPANNSPKTVIIGVHGISGHAGDYANLGEYLLKENPDTALYAAEIRGQGMDTKKSRRGDIRRVKDWYRDLYTFTGLVRQRYPKAKIVWFGESMGSLIVLHAYNQTPPGEKKPDGLVISSPIVDVGAKLPWWKYAVARTIAAFMPKLRISLETLAGVDRPKVTEDDIHPEQAAKNAWYIHQYTLRLLQSLSDMSDSIGEQAAKVKCPVLVLHGGKDIFTSDASVKAFYAKFPAGLEKKMLYYPGSYHLLMYDHEREKIFKDVSKWLKTLN